MCISDDEREKDDDENIFRVFRKFWENPSHKINQKERKKRERERDEESSQNRQRKEEKKKRKKEKKHTQQVSSHSPLPSSSRHTFP